MVEPFFRAVVYGTPPGIGAYVEELYAGYSRPVHIFQISPDSLFGDVAAYPVPESMRTRFGRRVEKSGPEPGLRPAS